MKKLILLFIALTTISFAQDRPAPRPLYYDGTYWSWWRIGSTPAVPDSGIRLSIEDEPILDRKVLSIKSGAIGIPDTTYLDLVLRNLYFYSGGKFSKVADTLKAQSGKIIEHSTLIAQNADDIYLEALERRGKDTTLEASIKINAENIELKVAKDQVISSINLTPEAAKIKANRIELNGYTVIKNINGSNDSTTIDAGKVKTTDITALGNVTAGSFNLGNGKFKVSSSGVLSCSDADITGSITSNSGADDDFRSVSLSHKSIVFNGYYADNISITPTSNKLNVNASISANDFLLGSTSIQTLLNGKASSTHTHSVTTQTIQYLDWMGEQKSVTVVTGIGGVQ